MRMFQLSPQVSRLWSCILAERYAEARRLANFLSESEVGACASHFLGIQAALDISVSQHYLAEQRLNACLSEFSKDGDICSGYVCHLYLTYLYLICGNHEEADKHLAQARSLTDGFSLDLPSYLWHPRVMAHVFTYDLSSGQHSNWSEQVLLTHLRDYAVRFAAPLLRDDKFSVRLRAGHILRQLDDTDRLLARVSHPASRHILREFVATSRLRRLAFPRLIRSLTTAYHRPRPNFTLVAVFALYTHGLHRPTIARTLDLAEPTVRNAITTLYRIFDLPALRFARRAERRACLVDRARQEGFIAADPSHLTNHTPTPYLDSLESAINLTIPADGPAP